MDWYLEAFGKYADFTGRSRRKEYWFFTLFNVLATVSLAIVDGVTRTAIDGGVGVLAAAYFLAVIIPGLAVTVRRLHDTGRSGWWILISCVPFIGGIVLLVFTLQDSEQAPNQYGPSPKYLAGAYPGAGIMAP